MYLSVLHKYGLCTDHREKIRSKDILNLCSFAVSFIQIETLTHMHTQPTADLNSPFLPEFGGPGGLSVTDPLKKKKNITCSKTREQQ